MMNNPKILYGGLRSLNAELQKDEWKGRKYVILLDENVFQCCLPILLARVETLQESDFIEVPAGEECKSIEVVAQVWQTLLEGGADRNTVIVNLGGGSICDLGGFVASTYMRGIRSINVPTTLLSMVDAAIGGKAAVDFGGLKNSVGTFYTASLTIIDHVFCATLQEEQMMCGYIEAVKTAAVMDAALYEELISTDGISKQQVTAVARMKSRVVKVDPYDHGIRHILNFGHTFGHGIEWYSHLPHGIAVGIGMLAAMYLSTKKLGLEEKVYSRYSSWLKRRVTIPRYGLKDIEQILELMHRDKKNSEGDLKCVLIKEVGAAVIDVSISDNEVRDALQRVANS